MIKLKKNTIPSVLLKNNEKWRQELLNYQKVDKVKPKSLTNKYNHKDIKQSLLAETYEKCAYCESKLRHIQHGDIEHILPKSLYPELTFEWENLTIACSVCNQNKSNLDPQNVSILNPYKDDPEQSLIFFGTMISSLDEMGFNSINHLDLNRTELQERRKEKLEYLNKIISTITNEKINIYTRQAIYEDFLNNELCEKNEYAAMAKALHKYLEPKLQTI